MATHRKAANKPLTAAERHSAASHAALAGIRQRGTDILRDNLRSGFLRRFERQVDDTDPQLRANNPAEFERRVHQALTTHMQQLSAKSVAARAAKRAGKTSEKSA